MPGCVDIDAGDLLDDPAAVIRNGRPVLPLGHIQWILARHWHLHLALRHRPVDHSSRHSTSFYRPIPQLRTHLLPPVIQILH